jgi:hypothetical protein
MKAVLLRAVAGGRARALFGAALALGVLAAPPGALGQQAKGASRKAKPAAARAEAPVATGPDWIPVGMLPAERDACEAGLILADRGSVRREGSSVAVWFKRVHVPGCQIVREDWLAVVGCENLARVTKQSTTTFADGTRRNDEVSSRAEFLSPDDKRRPYYARVCGSPIQADYDAKDRWERLTEAVERQQAAARNAAAQRDACRRGCWDQLAACRNAAWNGSDVCDFGEDSDSCLRKRENRNWKCTNQQNRCELSCDG